MGLSFAHILVVVVVCLLLFGSGRSARVMKELGTGIRGFKEGLSGEDEQPRRIDKRDAPRDDGEV